MILATVGANPATAAPAAGCEGTTAADEDSDVWTSTADLAKVDDVSDMDPERSTVAAVTQQKLRSSSAPGDVSTGVVSEVGDTAGLCRRL